MEEWVSDFLTGYLERRGFELYEVTYRREPVGWVLRITLDRKGGGLTVHDTTHLSHEIGGLLDAAPEGERLLPGPYHLEVSSPGIFRPLKTRRDYERAWQRRVKLRVEEEPGRVVEKVGILQTIEESGVDLESEGRIERILWTQIVGGQLYPELPF